jgi:hypothetical protein
MSRISRGRQLLAAFLAVTAEDGAKREVAG